MSRRPAIGHAHVKPAYAERKSHRKALKAGYMGGTKLPYLFENRIFKRLQTLALQAHCAGCHHASILLHLQR